MIGNGARRPETSEPSDDASAVMTSTIAAAATARIGRSQLGWANGTCSDGGAGVSQRPTTNEANATARPITTPGRSVPAARSTVQSPYTAQPKSRPVAQ